MLKGNKGEWSELYAFCYLLSRKILCAADKTLRPKGEYFPILKILREETHGRVLEYRTAKNNESPIEVYEEGRLLKTIEKRDLEKAVKILYEKIPFGERAFEIPEVEGFLEGIFIHKLKADSAHKQDIDIQIHDIHTGISPVCGFSIKSYLGSRPTLVNAGNGTNFVYVIDGVTDQIATKLNSIETRRKIIDRIEYLRESNCNILYSEEMVSAQFKENLQFVDSRMPEIISYLLLIAYRDGVKYIPQAVEVLKQVNPLGYSNVNMYEYKVKKMLCACALGMTPEKHWEGEEDANGGYIVVKNDGHVLCYHIYNRTDFEQYLYDYTCFDTPSTTRYGYMSLYKEDGIYKLKLNLQIRFI